MYHNVRALNIILGPSLIYPWYPEVTVARMRTTWRPFWEHNFGALQKWVPQTPCKHDDPTSWLQYTGILETIWFVGSSCLHDPTRLPYHSHKEKMLHRSLMGGVWRLPPKQPSCKWRLFKTSEESKAGSFPRSVLYKSAPASTPQRAGLVKACIVLNFPGCTWAPVRSG